MTRKQDERKLREEREQALDEALEETFPASDTPTIIQPVHHEHPLKKPVAD